MKLAQVEESKRWDFSKKINFSSDLNNILENHNVDIFFTLVQLIT